MRLSNNGPPGSSSPTHANKRTINTIPNTPHLIVSAYKDHRFDKTTRIISMYKRDQNQPLYCIFYCAGQYFTGSQAQVEMHSDHFGFPFVTTDLFCKNPPAACGSVTHVTVSTHSNISDSLEQTFLPIQNQEKKETFPYNFTVCVSNLFGGYNNVLQFVQTMELYKLLGVQRVTIYNTSCGPDLERVLLHYRDEGTVEVVQWPIDKFLIPSKGCYYNIHPGDIHYYGQLTTLNDCIYRNMYQTKYLLLHDIDETIMPYQHANLHELMDHFQTQNPGVAVFGIRSFVFPKTQADSSGKFKLPQWRNISGVNILEHIYREPTREWVFNPAKMLINPRMVEQTSVHSVLKTSGQVFNLPSDFCRLVHIAKALLPELTKEKLEVDKRLWDFAERLVPEVDEVLRKSHQTIL
ncbi:uncharacterized protein FYW47_013416 [Aplochiton taeniatus]